MKTYKEYKKEQPMVECPNCHIKIKVFQPLPLLLSDEYHEDMYISHEDEYFERKMLEEQNKKLEDIIDTYELSLKNSLKQNKELEDGFKATEELTEYATRVDKAIEYINGYLPNYDFDHSNLKKLLEMLKGDE